MATRPAAGRRVAGLANSLVALPWAARQACRGDCGMQVTRPASLPYVAVNRLC